MPIDFPPRTSNGLSASLFLFLVRDSRGNLARVPGIVPLLLFSFLSVFFRFFFLTSLLASDNQSGSCQLPRLLSAASGTTTGTYCGGETKSKHQKVSDTWRSENSSALQSLAVPIVDCVRSNSHEAFVDSGASSIVTAAMIDACDVYHTVRIFARR